MSVTCKMNDCNYATKEGLCMNESISVGCSGQCMCYTKIKHESKVVCPNGCNAHFSTTGRLTQLWEVNEFGDFQRV